MKLWTMTDEKVNLFTVNQFFLSWTEVFVIIFITVSAVLHNDLNHIKYFIHGLLKNFNIPSNSLYKHSQYKHSQIYTCTVSDKEKT